MEKIKKYTPQEAREELIKLSKISKGDPEMAHIEADFILLGILSELGYDEIVDLFLDIDKWYS